MPGGHFVTADNVFTKKNLRFFELSRSLSEKQHGSYIDPVEPPSLMLNPIRINKK
jgi:hypothetical protein